MAACDECGARSRDGATCRQQWDALLALEFSDPRAGSVHFLTVTCYQLQHPASFPLTAEARRWLADALREVIVHARPVATVRDVMHQEWDGSRRVREMTTTPVPTVRWSATVADVGEPDPERHVERVQAWAVAVLGDLDYHEAGGSVC